MSCQQQPNNLTNWWQFSRALTVPVVPASIPVRLKPFSLEWEETIVSPENGPPVFKLFRFLLQVNGLFDQVTFGIDDLTQVRRFLSLGLDWTGVLNSKLYSMRI